MRGLLGLRDGLARKVTSEPRLARGERRKWGGGSGGGQGGIWWVGGLERRAPGRGGEEQGTGVRGLAADRQAGQATQGLCSPESLAGGPLCDLLLKVWGSESRWAGGRGRRQDPAMVQVSAEGAGGQVDTAEGRAGPDSG